MKKGLKFSLKYIMMDNNGTECGKIIEEERVDLCRKRIIPSFLKWKRI